MSAHDQDEVLGTDELNDHDADGHVADEHDSDLPQPRLPDAAAPQRREEPRWSTRDRARERELLEMLADLPAGDPRRLAARDELVTMHLPLAAFLARRFRDRGEHLDDLTQVATIGLLKAVDRFERDRGVEFSTFATPTITGEIKRHFRDKGWAIRVPRRLQELRMSIGRATAELSQGTGHSPTVGELAAHLGVTEDEVLEGMESAQAYATLSLDAGSDSTDEGASIADTLGTDDPSLVDVDNRATLNPALATLPPRERRIIQMRFYENMTQSQIAEQIGISQMHVSRLLAKSLAQLRSGLVDPADLAPRPPAKPSASRTPAKPSASRTPAKPSSTAQPSAVQAPAQPSTPRTPGRRASTKPPAADAASKSPRNR
ncbi:MAG: SigB/SigF/SigG family RNA polymerase sigma factor [Candidatus Nanopelagicales bacterium]